MESKVPGLVAEYFRARPKLTLALVDPTEARAMEEAARVVPPADFIQSSSFDSTRSLVAYSSRLDEWNAAVAEVNFLVEERRLQLIFPSRRRTNQATPKPIITIPSFTLDAATAFALVFTLWAITSHNHGGQEFATGEAKARSRGTQCKIALHFWCNEATVANWHHLRLFALS